MPRNLRRYGYTGTEPVRCVCQTRGEATHDQHGKPKNQTGKHLDPRCPHSELYAHTVLYPALRARMAHTRAKARTLISPMLRIVGS